MDRTGIYTWGFKEASLSQFSWYHGITSSVLRAAAFQFCVYLEIG